MTRTNLHQRGVVLIVVLLFLLALSLLAVSTTRSISDEERLAGYSRQDYQAFEAAEAALSAAERYLGGAALGKFEGKDGRYHYINAPAPAATQATLTDMVAVTAYTGTGTAHYMIEELAPTIGQPDSAASDQPYTERRVFRITARGSAPGSAAPVLLQATFIR
ncbi:PilX N-terminal domain-containing pilus assembly protein [Hahella sp. SMD15-11]|uniref:PilX N-terminal domain-containing pilus assembly protein n=1 Tax=Thermohahella caldifontis TaxID=3142973 RepID=A0AB39UTI7_9GAMM